MGRKKRRKLNKLRLAGFLAIALCLFFVGVSIKNVISLHIENRQLEKTQQKLQAERKEKKEEFNNIKDMDYIEEQARKQLKMIKPGEQLYVLGEDEDLNLYSGDD